MLLRAFMNINLRVPYSSMPSSPRSPHMAFYSPAKSDFLFDGNDPVLICCQPYHRSVSLAWSLCRNSVRAPLAQGHVVPGLDNTYTIEIDMDSYSPGFYDLHVRLSLSGEQFLDGITAFAWHCEEESLIVTVPTDFDEFWNEAMASVARCPLDIQRTHFARLNRADIDAYNYTTAGLPEGYDPEGEIYDSVDIYRLSFASPSGSRIHGWLTTPSEPGCYPGMLVLPGAGNSRRKTMPDCSRPSSRWVSTFALMPGNASRSCPKRRGPSNNSRTTKSAQRSPTSSSPCAAPQASSYQSLGGAFLFFVTFVNFLVAKDN